MKETIRHILSGTLFLGLLAGMLLGLNFLFRPKDNTEAAGFHDPKAHGYLAEPENSVDVLFLGDSEAFFAFIPMQLWQEHGITSYVCSTGSQEIFQTEEYLSTVFRNQSPKIVVLETNVLYRYYDRMDIVPNLLERALPLFRYHDRWKSLGAEDFSFRVRYTGIQRDKGYLFRTEINPVDPNGYMDPSQELAPIPSRNQGHLERMISFCRERGAELVLVSSPSVENWCTSRHNSVTLLARELEVAYIDLNLNQGDFFINWELDTVDNGDHMNYSGARKVTACLGQYLAQTGLFTDKRADPDYAAWNQALESFLREHPETESATGN